MRIAHLPLPKRSYHGIFTLCTALSTRAEKIASKTPACAYKEFGAWPALPNVHAVQPSETYTTAVACLILQMPRRALPIYKNVDSKAVRSKLQLEN